ncbi:MAG: integrase family protein [Syntrophaceae bacterium]|nr:MAG: integrase family protein [Syntrophaceae bacterium]
MTTGKWEKTNFTGVRFRKHATRKHGVNFDRYFVIRYQRDGKRIEESLGWTSERGPEDGQFWTEAKAALVLERLRGAAKHGKKEAPTRLGEKREIERQRKEDEKAAQELAEKENVIFGYYFEKYISRLLKLAGKRKRRARQESISKTGLSQLSETYP